MGDKFRMQTNEKTKLFFSSKIALGISCSFMWFSPGGNSKDWQLQQTHFSLVTLFGSQTASYKCKLLIFIKTLVQSVNITHDLDIA